MPNEFVIKNGFISKGNSIVEGSLTSTGGLILSGNTNQIGNLNLTGNTNQIGNLNLTGNTNQIGNLNLTGNTFVSGNIEPLNDNSSDLGTSLKRFRDINTVSGTTSYWTATVKVITPELDLGNDSLGNPRTITANNSIIQNDTLQGGTY
jgi:hypothetical protein